MAAVNPPYAAVVLAGGAARRLRGQAKPELRLGGRRLLDLVLDSVPEADPRIVVGPAMSVPAGVRLLREEPAGGGPVAGLAAGLAALRTEVDLLAVLAADLPFLTHPVITALLDSVADGAVLVDDTGRDQLLLGVWRVAALRTAVAALPTVVGAFTAGHRRSAGRGSGVVGCSGGYPHRGGIVTLLKICVRRRSG